MSEGEKLAEKLFQVDRPGVVFIDQSLKSFHVVDAGGVDPESSTQRCRYLSDTVRPDLEE